VLERAGGGQQHGHAVAGHVGGGERGLVAVLGDLQAVGVDGDVLGRRGEGHGHGEGNQQGEVVARVAQRHAEQADGDQRLREDQPGTALAQRAEQRQAPLVEHRRPDPFEGVGEADPAGVADGFARHPGLAQPDRQRREHQHRRQPRGEAEQQQGE